MPELKAETTGCFPFVSLDTESPTFYTWQCFTDHTGSREMGERSSKTPPFRLHSFIKSLKYVIFFFMYQLREKNHFGKTSEFRTF